MFIIKSLLIFLIVINLNAMQKDIIYVEDKNINKISLKDEFFNPNTKYYTLTIATLKNDSYDIIEFFKRYKLTNALAYKYGKDKKYIKIISGVYKNGTLAEENIKNLSIQLQKNKPYSSKLFRHQNSFNPTKKEIFKTTIKKNSEDLKKIDLKNSKNTIFIKNTKEAEKLKKEFFNKKSKYYSIALGTVSSSKESLKSFFNTYGLEDKALAHVYGKNREKVRIIYGLYKDRKEAQNAIEMFDKKIKRNSPFPMKMDKFQSFYLKSFPNGLDKNSIVELKVNDKKQNEKIVKAKLSDEIKIVKPKPKPKSKVMIKETKKETKKIPEQKEKVIKKKSKKKVVKKTPPKRMIKKSIDNNKYLKETELEDVYFVESKGNFNILNEVFLNEGSSFYTVDLGELKLNEISIEEFFIKNSMEDDALAYKYGEDDEYARAIYGAYETKEAASKAIENLNVSSKDLRVSNIKNHQKLYKEYHKNGYNTKIKKAVSEDEKIIKSNFSYDGLKDDIVFLQSNGQKNLLKDEFFNRTSLFYTITLTTFLKENKSIENFLDVHGIKNNVLAYSIGSANNYYRIIYGLYETSAQARAAIQKLNYKLKKNMPFVSKIITNQKKFEQYNNRILEKEMNNSKRIEF